MDVNTIVVYNINKLYRTNRQSPSYNTVHPNTNHYILLCLKERYNRISHKTSLIKKNTCTTSVHVVVLDAIVFTKHFNN